MRPITSGIGSAPHALAKVLARPLARRLGSISTSHLKNSGDLLERLKDYKARNMTVVSFDVKALFTNVPTEEALEVVKEVINMLSDEELPLPRRDYQKLLNLCISFNIFEFEGEEFIVFRDGHGFSALTSNGLFVYGEVGEWTNFSYYW